MTLSEFKAWFEGYTDGMNEKRPSEKQWAKIQEKVGQISGTPISREIFINHYRHYYSHPIWNGQTKWGGAVGYSANNLKPIDSVTTAFDSHAAMFAVGKADALAA